MSLKTGDKVKMTARGFKFYSDLEISHRMSSKGSKMDYESFENAVCELFAIHGIGVVKKFNSYGDPYIRWDFSIGGKYFHYAHYFEPKDIKKLSLLDKIIFKLKGRF